MTKDEEVDGAGFFSPPRVEEELEDGLRAIVKLEPLLSHQVLVASSFKTKFSA